MRAKSDIICQNLLTVFISPSFILQFVVTGQKENHSANATLYVQSPFHNPSLHSLRRRLFHMENRPRHKKSEKRFWQYSVTFDINSVELNSISPAFDVAKLTLKATKLKFNAVRQVRIANGLRRKAACRPCFVGR